MLEAQTRDGTPIGADDLADIVSVIRNRAKALGANVVVQSKGRNQIVVQFPGRRPTGEVAAAVTDPGVLEFFDLETSLTPAAG